MGHIESVHLKVRRYKCDSCSFTSYKKHDMKRHVIKNDRHVASYVPRQPSISLQEMEQYLVDIESGYYRADIVNAPWNATL